jgi:hypothetical protein
MNEMIARLAHAIAAELGRQDDGQPFLLDGDLRLEYLDQSDVDFAAVARAALEALREPTEGMADAGWADLDWGPGGSECDANPRAAYRAMIDAALADTGKPGAAA